MAKKRKRGCCGCFSIFFTIFLIAGAILAFFSYKFLLSPNVTSTDGKEHVLYIDEDADFESVMDSLSANNILINESSFRRVASLKKYDQNIKGGRYTIQEGLNNQEIIGHIRLSGNQAPVKLVINNIRTKAQLAGLLGNTLKADSLTFLQLLSDASATEKYNFTPSEVEAIFLANTYEVFWNTTPEKVMERMKQEYDKFWTAERTAQAQAQGLTPFEAITLASIVEEETQMRSEMPIVAGLYLNRLKKGWKLQADPTVKYAVGDFSLRRVLNVHLETDSPYNTYMYEGLPPGPIRIPESDAIKAVLTPKDHNYMYMCANPRLDGSHAFARTNREHEQNAAKYRKKLDELKIYK